MAIIQFIYLLYTVRQTNPGSTGYKKHSEMPELSRFTANIVPRHWMRARLAHHFVLLNIVPGEPVPADLERKGQVEGRPCEVFWASPSATDVTPGSVILSLYFYTCLTFSIIQRFFFFFF